MTDDLRLLRAYEPVVRFTKGEYFYPVSVQRYVEQAALWGPDEGSPLVVGGELDLDRLARAGAAGNGPRSLSGIMTGGRPRPALIPVSDRPPRLRGGSRLAAVGLLARLIDALNRLSLLFRGSVPGGSAARSLLLQRDHLAPDEPTYHARVERDGPWIICQYWFFYAFNNWRSAFGGVNEHEADWEQVTIYLDGTGVLDDDGLPPARWVVFSAHDETGDDLRRRWDDPDLGLVDGRHPVVYAGAGSHSGAYLAGDYLITVPTPTLRGLVSVFRFIGRFLAPWSHSDGGGMGMPYIDYARGDGRVIGPGGDPWHPVVIDVETPWVRDFRGLWGHDTRDRLGGERGPAGPRYERDGTVRKSWGDRSAGPAWPRSRRTRRRRRSCWPSAPNRSNGGWASWRSRRSPGGRRCRPPPPAWRPATRGSARCRPRRSACSTCAWRRRRWPMNSPASSPAPLPQDRTTTCGTGGCRWPRRAG